MNDQEQVTEKEVIDLFKKICDDSKSLHCSGFYVNKDRQYLYRMCKFKTDYPELKIYRVHNFDGGPVIVMGRVYLYSRAGSQDLKFLKDILLDWKEQIDKHYEKFIVPLLHSLGNTKAPEGFLTKGNS